MENNFNEFRTLQINNGVPVVKLDIFDSVYNLKIDDKVINKSEYLYEYYVDLIKEISLLSNEDRIKLTSELKKNEIYMNQILENMNPDLIKNAFKTQDIYSIDFMMNLYGKKLESKDIVDIHKKIIEGVEDTDKYGLRCDNSVFVWKSKNGNKTVDYLPLDYKDIDSALELLARFCNNNMDISADKSMLLVKPIIIHGLIACLQLFNDGNTRLARMFQNVGIWGLTSNLDKDNIVSKEKEPIVLSSSQYYPYYNEYRGSIASLASNYDNETWNAWLKFNLSRIEENLWLIDDKLNDIKIKNSIKK